MVAGSSPAGCAMSGFWHKQMQYGGRSSVGRAQDCGSWCRGFDPLRPPHIPENARQCLAFSFQARLADVVKLVDTPDLGSGAARCESSSLSVRTTTWFRGVNDSRNTLKAPSSGLFCARMDTASGCGPAPAVACEHCVGELAPAVSFCAALRCYPNSRRKPLGTMPVQRLKERRKLVVSVKRR